MKDLIHESAEPAAGGGAINRPHDLVEILRELASELGEPGFVPHEQKDYAQFVLNAADKIAALREEIATARCPRPPNSVTAYYYSTRECVKDGNCGCSQGRCI